MKHLFILISFILSSFFLQAQDTIYKKNKGRVLCKVLEINSDTVRYHQASMPDGPVYKLGIHDILRIRYEDGQTDYFEERSRVSQTPVAVTGTTPAPDAGTNNPPPSNTTPPETSTQSVPPTQSGVARGASYENKYRIEETRNRYYIDGRRSSLRMVTKVMMMDKDPKIYMHLKEAHSRKTGATVCGVLSIPATVIGGSFLLFGLAATSVNSTNSSSGGGSGNSSGNSGYVDPTPFFVVGVLGMASGITLNIGSVYLKKRSRDSLHLAMDIYNGPNL